MTRYESQPSTINAQSDQKTTFVWKNVKETGIFNILFNIADAVLQRVLGKEKQLQLGTMAMFDLYKLTTVEVCSGNIVYINDRNSYQIELVPNNSMQLGTQMSNTVLLLLLLAHGIRRFLQTNT